MDDLASIKETADARRSLHDVPRWFLPVAFLLLLASAVGWSYLDAGSFSAVSDRQKDDVFYENIAFNLAAGRGFELNFSDPEWQQPYRDNNSDGHNDWVLETIVSGPTTARAPAFSWIASQLYRMFGRSWSKVYLFNVLFMAFGLTLLLNCLVRRHGLLVAGFALLTLCLDFAVMRTGFQFMTEAMGTGLLAILFVSVIFASSMRLAGVWLLVGFVFGVTLLTRPNLNAWLLEIFTLLAIVCAGRWWRGQDYGFLLRCGLAFGLAVAVVAGPWWHRNVDVTGHFTPVGSAGSIGMTGGYCDAAVANRGNWDVEQVRMMQRETVAIHDISNMTLAQQEYLMGQVSSQMARTWVAQNFQKLPMLFVGRALNHLGVLHPDLPLPVKILNVLFLFGALLGVFLDRRQLGFWIGFVLFLSLTTTVLTWSNHGRYLLPVRPILHCGCAIGTVRLWQWIFRQFGLGKQ